MTFRQRQIGSSGKHGPDPEGPAASIGSNNKHLPAAGKRAETLTRGQGSTGIRVTKRVAFVGALCY